MSLDLFIVAGLVFMVLFTLYLKTNVALSIFGLGMGYVLASLTIGSITSFLYESGIRVGDFPLEPVLAIFITILPAFLVLMRFKKIQTGRFFEHVIPAVFFALFFILLILLQLPFDIRESLDEKSYAFNQFEYFKTAIVVGTAGIAIFDVMIHEQKLMKKGRKNKNKG